MTIYILLTGLSVAGAILTLFFGFYSRRQMRIFRNDRMYFASTTPTLEEVELNQPFGKRILQPTLSSLLGFFGRLAPQRNVQELRHKLEVAGRPFAWRVSDFLGLQLLSALLCGALFFVLMLFGNMATSLKVLLTAVFAVLGFYLPPMWLGLRIRQRKAAIARALPDGLDMLNICVGAGLGFDSALSKIGEQWNNPLAEEFNRVFTEILLGKSRRQALLDLTERTEVTAVENFVATLIQADQLGVSIAKVLRAQAEQMRTIRRQRAEETARKATIRLLFPLVFLIFPSMLAVLLGPAVPQLLRALGSLSQ